MSKKKPFDHAPFVTLALRAMQPPEDISVSQWAQKYRVLDRKSSAIPGRWNNDVTPYLVAIMDEMNNPDSEEIVFVKPTQVGGTEAIFNMLAYSMAQDPAPCMVVYPTKDLAEGISQNRLQPMIKLCEPTRAIFKEKESKLLQLQFDGAMVLLAGSNSPAGLASYPIRYLFLDEVDKYPGASSRESDPVSLSRERTKTFANRKIVMASTPTIKDGHIWQGLETADVIKHYKVPCPHCGEYIEFCFDNIKLQKDSAGKLASQGAIYFCERCGCQITDAQKPAMLRRGHWETVAERNKNHKKVAYWLNTLYSPFVKWEQIAQEFIKSLKDPERLHNFKNSWLAQVWENVQKTQDAQNVLERRSELSRGVVPQWAKMLTMGVDVQRGSLYYVIRAWGAGLNSQLVDCGQVVSFTQIEVAANKTYYTANNSPFLVSLALADSGDGETMDEVYEFCTRNSEWAIACKGVGNSLSHYRISRINKVDSVAYGQTLALVDGGKYKDSIMSRLARDEGDGAFMVYEDIELDYCVQLTNEHKVSEKKGGAYVQIWKPKTSHADNHYLDAEVYAFAAADMLGARTLEEMEQPEKAPQVESDEVQTNSYLGGAKR